jgi:hypothetical protein
MPLARALHSMAGLPMEQGRNEALKKFSFTSGTPTRETSVVFFGKTSLPVARKNG